jgi:general stress protein CsbA
MTKTKKIIQKSIDLFDRLPAVALWIVQMVNVIAAVILQVSAVAHAIQSSYSHALWLCGLTVCCVAINMIIDYADQQSNKGGHS